MKWLLAGTGDVARKRVAAALTGAAELDSPGGELVGVCGQRDRAAALARSFGADEVWDDLEQALARTRADAVYIATPVDRHRHEAVAALTAGKHVLIEKPLGLDAADAQAIVDAWRGTALVAACAYYRRAAPRFEHLRQLLADGTLGRVVLVRMIYSAWYAPAADDPKRWRIDPARSGGGVLADMGSHMCDLLIALFGMPSRVAARVKTSVHGYAADDSANILMTLPGGADAVVSLGWNSQAFAHELEVIGTHGRVKWSPLDAGPVLVTRGRETEEVQLPPLHNPSAPFVRAFERAIAGAGQSPCPLPEALRTTQLLDAIYRSSQNRMEVDP